MTDAARAALLARLPAVGFVPPADAAPWSLAARSAAFAAAVEAFTAQYWALPPAERAARYNTMWNGRYGPAAARLGLLEPGLDVIHPRGRTTHAELVRELDAIRRRAVAVQHAEMRARTVTYESLTAPPPQTAPADMPRFPGREVGRPANVAGVRVNSKLLAGAAAVAVAVGLLLANGLFPEWFADDKPARTRFTADEVRAFETYHFTPGGRRRTAPPAGYDDWVRAGRPAARTSP